MTSVLSWERVSDFKHPKLFWLIAGRNTLLPEKIVDLKKITPTRHTDPEWPTLIEKYPQFTGSCLGKANHTPTCPLTANYLVCVYVNIQWTFLPLQPGVIKVCEFSASNVISFSTTVDGQWCGRTLCFDMSMTLVVYVLETPWVYFHFDLEFSDMDCPNIT